MESVLVKKTQLLTQRRDIPVWADLSEQAERVSGETEGPQRQSGKSEPDLPGEGRKLDLYLCF